jgi:prepilin-type N-terminal cleavage/methylation domain-containing protein
MNFKPCQGFTLLEVMVALLVMAITTTVVLKSASGLQDQVRYETTVERVDFIKKAILDIHTVNGNPVISGFVADLGRLPNHLRELLEIGLNRPWATGRCLDSANQLLSDDNREDCQNHSTANRWIENPAGMGIGWHGPYLHSAQNPGRSDAFTDGWGKSGFLWTQYSEPMACNAAGYRWNTESSVCEDSHTYGWYYSNHDNLAITLFSYGSDYQPGTASCSNSEYKNQATCEAEGEVWEAGGTCSNAFYKDQINCQCNGGVWTPARNVLYSADYPSSCPDKITFPAPPPLIAPGDWLVDPSQGISVQFRAPLYDGICRLDNVNKNACYNNAGRFEKCVFTTPELCVAAGGSWATECRWISTTCIAKGGNWNTSNNPQCVFNAATCPAVGGTWSTANNRCYFTTTACETMGGGIATRSCQFNAAACRSLGGPWNAGEQACELNQTRCTNRDGLRTDATGSNGFCLRLFQDASSGVKYDEHSCLAANGVWDGGQLARPICMKLFFRGINGIMTAISDADVSDANPITPWTIQENGSLQTLRFGNFKYDDGTRWVPVSGIPAGHNALGIFEYDGKNCTDKPYPADREIVRVDWQPRSALPMLYW